MDKRWTKGPWSVTRSDRRGTLCVISEDTWICGELESNNELSIPRAESSANARLIAAAPDLAEALEKWLAADDGWYEALDRNAGEAEASLDSAKIAARAALAKAHGEA